MKYNIQYDKRCLKYLRRIDKKDQLRILKAIKDLPYGDVKKLQGRAEDYRLRVRDYRIIFTKDDEELLIYVIEIAPRRDVYK